MGTAITTDFDAWLADAEGGIRQREAARAADMIDMFAEYARKLVADWPPLSDDQRDHLALLLADNGDGRPKGRPVTPTLSGRALDPEAGSLYARHLRATDGGCQRCGTSGGREVDHCHEHNIVRGLICRSCNLLAERSMGDKYRACCQFCAWETWRKTVLV